MAVLLSWLNLGFAASIDTTRGHCLPFQKSEKYFTLSVEYGMETGVPTPCHATMANLLKTIDYLK